jgi:hypothetical protein
MKTNDNGTDRDMTDAEIAEYEQWQKDFAKEQKQRDKNAADRSAARQIVLDRLGITADEAALLLG